MWLRLKCYERKAAQSADEVCVGWSSSFSFLFLHLRAKEQVHFYDMINIVSVEECQSVACEVNPPLLTCRTQYMDRLHDVCSMCAAPPQAALMLIPFVR